MEAELADVHAVLDAADSERAALFSYTAGGVPHQRVKRSWRVACGYHTLCVTLAGQDAVNARIKRELARRLRYIRSS